MRDDQTISVTLTDETGAIAQAFTIPASHHEAALAALRTIQAEAAQARLDGKAHAPRPEVEIPVAAE